MEVPKIQEERAFEQLDQWASKLIRAVDPIRFHVATRRAARECLFRLRYHAVIERGWARPEDFTDHLETDAYDARAVHVGGWNGPDAVATARLIFPHPKRPLPVEEIFDLRIEPQGSVVHVDRFTVARRHSEGTHRLFLALIGRCWLEMRARGLHLGAGIDSLAMLRLYRRLGFSVSILGPPRHYWAEDRYPVLFEPAGPRLAAGLARDRTLARP
jgi:N-acyl-L-homoserine lactone synthetase